MMDFLSLRIQDTHRTFYPLAPEIQGQRDGHHGPRDFQSDDSVIDIGEESEILQDSAGSTNESNYSVPARRIGQTDTEGLCQADYALNRHNLPEEEPRRGFIYVPSLWSEDQSLPPPVPVAGAVAVMDDIEVMEGPVEMTEIRLLLEDYRAVGCADDQNAHIPRCATHPYMLALQEEWDNPTP